jgi:uncharacterized protein (TIGR00297 family)
MNDLGQIAGVMLVGPAPNVATYGAITVAFAALARAVRGVTNSGSIAGGTVCFGLMLAAGWGGFAALATVFLLTWVATRVGYARKLRLGTAEGKSGRNAGQVLANLGVPLVAALLYLWLRDTRLLVASSAALAEVAADTLASEIGQVFGGKPRLVTTWEAVPAGTDGAITLGGTLAAIGAAAAIALVCVLGGVIARGDALVCMAAGFIGMMADSFMGATVEGRGYMGNNGVNFFSTVIAAVLALSLS